ncbi:Disease resistance protein RGA2, partial [Mucuna pruriens]
MAESFLFSIAESLLSKLACRAYGEASRVLGLYHHLQEFKENVPLVKAVLLDAEQKLEQNHERREWTKQLKRVFSCAEDVLDEFECQTLRNQVVKAHGTTKDKVGLFFSNSNPIVFRYRMAQQIKDINKRLDKLGAYKDKFGLQIIDVDTRVVHQRDITHSPVIDSDVIGREHDKGEILHLLMQQNSKDDEKSHSVIPIVVGMGGLGKTTLAKGYMSVSHSRCGCVSDGFDVKQLIIKIINFANDSAFLTNAPHHPQNLNILDMEQLQNRLRNKHVGHKFLLVLDDVWNEDLLKWVELRNLLQVGAAAGIKWTFNEEGEEEKYPHLINIGTEIVKKCRGVPPAVRPLGSLLFLKFEANEWEYLRENEIWNLPQKENDILPTLRVSCDLMPSYLRQCFALFSLYPKDYEFVNLELTALWGALGLLASPKKNMTQEDVANQYLDELLSRSFIQDFANFGTACVFKIHDLVHDLAVLVAKDECQLVNSNIQSISEDVRHLSFIENDFHGKSFTPKSEGMRTILFPSNASKFATVEPGGCMELEALPKGLRKLISLRDFVITTKQAALPDNEIANLSSLQYLTIKCCNNVESLFSGIEFPILKSMPLDSKHCPALEILVVVNCDNLELSNGHEAKTIVFDSLPQLVTFPHWLQGSVNTLQTLILGHCNNLEVLLDWLPSLTCLKLLLVQDCLQLRSLSDGIHCLTALECLEIIDCPELCRKYKRQFGEYWKEISHVKQIRIFETKDLPQELVSSTFLTSMAELLLFSIAESLIAKLASRAYEETSRVLGLYHHLQDFTLTLSLVKAVLLDAEKKQQQNHELQEWLRQIKRVFSDAENVLDELECETLRKQVVKAHGTTKTKVAHFFSSSNPLVFHYRMSQGIKKIKKRLDMVAAERHKFGLETINVDRRVVHRRDMTYSYVVDSDVIGRNHDKENIIQHLMQQNPNDDDKSLSVIPIVGIGGLVKTTLAKFVFNDSRVHELFPLKMWVCVPNDFDIKQVTINIVNSTSNSVHQQNLNMLDMEQLQSQLRNKLASKKFLLVLDDVWNEDLVNWVELRDLLQVGASGSKILVTTRSHSIASMMGTVPSYISQGLSMEDSLSLFVKWAFKEGEEKKYPYLVNIGREIVKKCLGVPLAVRTLGSLLFSKANREEWEFVRDNEIWNSIKSGSGMWPALKLSFDQMPSNLRQCFALFNLYPVGYAFDSFDVTSLWGALGLLPSPNRDQIFKHGANQYLYELLSRSFLQDFVDYGIGFAFKIHDLVHDTARYLGRDSIIVRYPFVFRPEHGYVQHLSFPENVGIENFPIHKFVGARTILFPTAGVGANSEGFLYKCTSWCKHLRFLDLSDSTYKALPPYIGKLKHLRYLSLENNNNLKRLPDSLCNLPKLEVLILSGCTELLTLPKGLRKLMNLQHLEITTKLGMLPEDEIENLSSLRTLRIELCNNVESLFGGIKLPTLKVLCIANCKSLKSLPLDIEHFPELETLLVDNCNMLELSKEHNDQNSNLRLKIVNFISLPQLVTLPHWLEGSVDTLQYLLISSCNNLVGLPEWLSAMNFLKTLCVTNCPNMLSIPDEIHRLTTLERYEIDGHPELRQHLTIDEPEEVDEELE